ncbi:hypothetical protein [Methylobacterium sp. 17Sr1-1]|uniref:hypothetical protein n=1 Tax=Methylobacterium sp. 17Sr1-1 TaxID=2202826 RepID=UPI000D6F537E|nr:hypothetical protein [Methylobacterium sp. 17Sr1-1]AWN50597.1 hypothetical protein DK412_01700 [Methylobacterium sp. 17Sr1-1]
MRRHFIIILCGLILTPAYGAEAPFPTGRWAGKPAWCKNRPGETDALPQIFTRTSIEGYENSCRITRITGSNPFDVATVCEGEGMTSKDRTRYFVDGDRMTVQSLTDARSRSYTLHRCRG